MTIHHIFNFIQGSLIERTRSSQHENQYIHNIMETPDSAPNPELLLQLVSMQMPYGKYKGTLLCDLPVYYLEWFQRQGFPQGKLGILLATMYEIRLNGLEKLLTPLRERY